MDFEFFIKNIQKLKDVDVKLCERLKAYVYDVQGCCITVHQDLGPYLNEYMYQEALKITFEEKKIPYQKEYYFSVVYHGKRIEHKHYVDFFVKDSIFIECKAIASIGPEQRQQLWNYMRLTGVKIGLLYNFAPYKDQCERYYLCKDNNVLYMF